ncbi:MAG: pentapeptide repeat-containing protein [Pseudonocardiales bacterium]|nr:pentapeptide repeat-containing protein [Pseudonocardiales bacterium]
MPDPTGDPVPRPGGRQDLRADCDRCVGLCCVAPVFAASADFAIDKPAGQPCPHLNAKFRCGIHNSLRERGFPGCAVFDCFGAGQHVTQLTFGGADWRASPAIATSMFTVFMVLRQLKELLWYVAEALTLLPTGPLRDELVLAGDTIAWLTDAGPDELAVVDVIPHRQHVGALLARVSQAMRAEIGLPGPNHTNADLVGADLRGANLRGAVLRGACLLGADLRGADLSKADLLGADLRATDVRATELDRALFLTQPQLDAARGDALTTIPAALARPPHWPSPSTPTDPAINRPRRRRR